MALIPTYNPHQILSANSENMPFMIPFKTGLSFKYSLFRKTKIDDVTPAPASAGVNLSPRKQGAGLQSEKAGFPPEFIPHTMRGGNDKYCFRNMN